ncbi:MAG: DNA internalization-related competence protein ComEC/Rec2, partial [Thermoanaerobaculia bacterium]
YARFPPPPIGMSGSLRAEGFLRRSLRGESTLTVKSPALLAYGPDLAPYLPGSWNRVLMMRLRPHEERFPTEVALIEAIALGHGEHLAETVRSGYRRGGTYHLLVFSGLQIALAALMVSTLLRCLHAPRIADWALLILSILAPLFIGPSASVSRATVGLGLYALSRILHRPTTLENLWCIAALLRLVAVPGDLTEAAFHLTYAGSAALLFIGKPLARARFRWGAFAIAAELAITPLTLFHFHQYALGGSLMTILMTPVVFLMLCVSMATCMFPWPALFQAVGALHGVCTWLNASVSGISGFFAAPSSAVLTGAAVAALMVIAWMRGRWRAAALLAICCAPLLNAAVVATWDVDSPQLTVLDVGQGDALLLRTPGHAMLIDSGGRIGDDRFGEVTLLPLLLDRGVRRLDIAILTHAHPDHCGGMPAVVLELEIGEGVWISPHRFRGPCAHRLLEACAVREVPLHLIRGGEARSLGGTAVRFRVAGRHFKRSSENNGSVVTEAQIGARRILLTGDIEGEAEGALVDDLRAASILKVAHHGSRTSSTAALLDVVRPAIALISCGRGTLFGHPHPSVLEALRKRGIRIWRTDRNGTIDLRFRGAHVFVHPEIDTPR